MADKKLGLKTINELIQFQDEFIKRYIGKYGETPYIDFLIQKALKELKEVKESESV
ncbi:MAG: hypothetical protein K2L82_14050 [Lachnospiraceae bacterium]|nr:hypothetical protein [Lachnospiraceae bacterium]